MQNKKSKPNNTSGMRWQNIPGKEQIFNVATFQYHFTLVVAKAVFGFASGFSPIW